MPTVGEPTDSRGEPLQDSAASKDALRLLEALPVPVFVLADSRFVFVNEAQARILGASSAADVLGNRIDKFLHADTREHFLRTLDELTSEVGSSRSITEKWVRLDGRSLTIEYIIKSLAYEGGTALEGVLRKVFVGEPPAAAPVEKKGRRKWFSRSKAPDEPRRSPTAVAVPAPPVDAVNQALDALPQGIYWVDDLGVCRYINPAGAEMLGYEAVEVIGKPIHQLAHYRTTEGDLVSADDCPLHTTRGTLETRTEQSDVMWKWDGSALAVRASSAPLPGGGRVVSFRAREEEPAPGRKDIDRAVAAALADRREAASEAVAAAIRRERAAAGERLDEAVGQERKRAAQAVEEAVAGERHAAEGRLAEAITHERAGKQEAVVAAVSAERAAAKRSMKEAVAAERSLAETAVRDAARVATDRANREIQDNARTARDQEIQAAVAAERAEAERVLNQRLAEERAAFERALAAERETVQSAAAREVAEAKNQAEQLIAEQRRRTAEEREVTGKALNEALAAERARAEEEIQAAVAEAREAALRTMEEARVQAVRDLEQSIRTTARRELEGGIAAERRAAQAAIVTAVEAERAKFQAAIRQLSEDARRAASEAMHRAVEMERVASVKAANDAVALARASWEREQAARPADPRLTLLLDSIADGVYALGMDGGFTHVNRAAAEMLDFDPAKLLGQSAHETIHYKRRDGSPYPLEECPIHSGIALGHMTRGDDEVFWNRKGAPFPIDYSYAPLHQGSSLEGGVVTFKDVTERKLVSQEVAQSDRMSSLGRFAAAATHEFDKVLQGIRAASEVIRWHNSGEELENAKAQLVRMLERGSHLTRQISRFTEPREAEAKPIELVDWFQAFLQAARVALKENIELNFRLPDETLYVRADSGQLNQIFMNLILNARDAMPRGGRLTLSIDSCLSGSTYSFGIVPTPDRFIHFVVEDSGAGIPPELMSRIFEPLFTTKGSGTAGMGLAICHQLVRKLGGSIFVESTPGSGTQFHIFLPAAHPEMDEPEEAPLQEQQLPAVAQAPPPAAPAPVQTKRIVVISTEPLPLEQARAAADAGVDIEVVYGGTEAASSIQKRIPDALLMEISWMEADGVDVYRDIATRWPKLPMIVSTAKIHEVKIRGGIPNLPNVRYLPYDLPTLLKWVEGSRK